MRPPEELLFCPIFVGTPLAVFRSRQPRRFPVGLRDKYNHAIQTAKQLGFDGSAEERDGKLHFNGTAKSEDDKNRIWTALKTIPDWQKEVAADIRVKPGAPAPSAASGASARAAAPAAQQTY